MTSRDFCYWLQGFFEIPSGGYGHSSIRISAEEVKVIKRHLAMVFKHEIDPSYGGAEHQAELTTIHDTVAPQQPPFQDSPSTSVEPWLHGSDPLARC